MTHTANEIPQLRMRIRGDQVVLYDELHPSFTEQRVDEAIERQGERFLLPDEQARDDCRTFRRSRGSVSQG